MSLVTTVGADNAESYVAVADVSAYATKFGKTFATSPAAAAEAACRVATRYIDMTYRDRFPGEAASSTQALEWPRTCVWYRCEELPSDEIPQQILDATCEAAIRELASPGTLAPDLSRNDQLRSVSAGSVSLEWAANAPVNAIYQTIDGILSALLGDDDSAFSMQASRG
jgi:hypothetical protein